MCTASVGDMRQVWRVGNYGISDHTRIEIDISSTIASSSDVIRESLVSLKAKVLKQCLGEFKKREDAQDAAALDSLFSYGVDGRSVRGSWCAPHRSVIAV